MQDNELYINHLFDFLFDKLDPVTNHGGDERFCMPKPSSEGERVGGGGSSPLEKEWIIVRHDPTEELLVWSAESPRIAWPCLLALAALSALVLVGVRPSPSIPGAWSGLVLWV